MLKLKSKQVGRSNLMTTTTTTKVLAIVIVSILSLIAQASNGVQIRQKRLFRQDNHNHDSHHDWLEEQPLSTDDLFNLKNTRNSHAPTSRSLGDSEPHSSGSCGYASCPDVDPNKLNVHIVAHTHDDVGWLKTVDQYYYGTKKRFSPVGVQHILDSIIPQLIMDETKRFIYVEMSFFSKWWNEQDERMRLIVKRLVNEGRLEFINGGWCMNDEATVNYQSTIEQMTLGLRFLNDTFGSCAHPKVGWQIDPFGHTNEQASQFAQFGFDGMFFTRISYRDKNLRIQNKSLDLIWHGDRILSGQAGSIYTNIFIGGYDAPQGHCYDVFCYDDDLVDNKQSFEFNINRKGQDYLGYIRRYAEHKAIKNLLIPMGGDFHYSAAGQNFKNIDKMIRYIRQTAPDINIFYSTPSCYQWAVYRELQARPQAMQKLPEKYDDFMPYDDADSVWWSGYFSSRTSVKLVERETLDLMQVARLISFANLVHTKPSNNQQQQQSQPKSSRTVTPHQLSWIDEVHEHQAKCLTPLWEILGDLQHHDAVSGTEKQHVADDYVRRAYDAWVVCARFLGDLRRSRLMEIINKSSRYDQLIRQDAQARHRYQKLASPVFLESTMLCPLLNISQCDAMETEVDPRPYLASTPISGSQSEPAGDNNGRSGAPKQVPNELSTKSVLLNVYNPLVRPVDKFDIRLPCKGRCELEKVRVIHLSTNLTMQLIRLPVSSGVQTLPFRDATTNYEFLFYATIPGLGYTSYVIEDTNNDEAVDDEVESIIESPPQSPAVGPSNDVRTRRIRRLAPAANEYQVDNLTIDDRGSLAWGPQDGNYDYFAITTDDGYEEIKLDSSMKKTNHLRLRRSAARRSRQTHNGADGGSNDGERIIVKFDLGSGMIVGLRRTTDGAVLNITQKFGYYNPAVHGHYSGAYIFRPNTSEPILIDRPSVYKMYKRKSGALIEIHQKWTDWLWQTIRVDARKNYIEFDYVVGPIPLGYERLIGREVITRYITNLTHNGIFMTDSNGRQMMPRRRLKTRDPVQLGGSFYPVVSTILLKNTANTTNSAAEMVAVLVDRAQAGSSLNEGQIELLIHRRIVTDDEKGVGEPLNEPGEDGRGLVTRGRHRLYLKFPELPNPDKPRSFDLGDEANKPKSKLFKLPETPRASLEFESYAARIKNNISQPINRPTFIAHDSIYNNLRKEANKFILKPIMTFDRLRVSASEFIALIGNDPNRMKTTELSLLNSTLPDNIHLLTLQPLASGTNEMIIRLENLNNPLSIHPYPEYENYNTLLRYYKNVGEYFEADADENWEHRLRLPTSVDIEYLLKRTRIVSLEELNLGANSKLSEDKRLNWTGEMDGRDLEPAMPNNVSLTPRQIRTFLAKFEQL